MRISKDYSPSGPTILADDLGHPDDVVERITDALRKTKVRDAQTFLSEAMCYLAPPGVTIRRWLSTDFLDTYIKLYSKSRRKAPVYWQFATPSASYSIWTYYHRSTKDALYKVLSDYAAPKLNHEERKLTDLIQTAGPTPTATQRKEITAQESFVEELRAFREEVARIAPLWNPT